ncbi:MAG: MXAN_5187 family protein [Myxococcales bacterium]|nr:hypothetical protein [Polyangiaceae bacterium]MDW8248581.1 MXAN_5187 family protein [Myxococcales bacterium]
MIASRLWYIVLSLVIGFLTFQLYVASSHFDRSSQRSMREGLNGDAQVVSWYLRDDARKRSSALINFALDPDLAAALSKASSAPTKPTADVKDKVKQLLKTVDEKLPPELQFTALFAIDQYGRVVAQKGFDQALGIEDFELGGYPIVADALHGWIRDDTWVLDGRIYRVVARPVEYDTSQPPAGAIVGARIVDDGFARELTKRTNAAVAFFAAKTRVAAAAPEGFPTAMLDAITTDLDGVEEDKDYKEKGRSNTRVLRDNLAVVYSLIPGESWELGAGFAVGRQAELIGGPAGFFAAGDDNDKKAVKIPVVAGVTLLSALLGLIFSFLEHSKPLRTFQNEAARFAKGEVDQLAPSKFFSSFRKIASDINDGIDKAIAKGGGTRKAADLEQVLGPIPAQPTMSAFSFPGEGSPASGESSSIFKPELSGSFNLLSQPAASSPSGSGKPGGPPPPRNPRPGAEVSGSRPVAAPPAEQGDATVVGKVPELIEASADDTADWPQVFEDFLRVKRQNGESTDGLTFEKFQKTLRKNREALIQQHGCKRVKFTVYVKEGRAALKASPVRE